MPLDVVQTLSDLVAIPSVNPMGRPITGPEFLEHRLTDHLQQLFESLGLPWIRQPIEPQRENIIARLDGPVSPERGGKILMLEAHQDTVPTDGMTIDPFKPEIHEGRIYGRGACDIKGGMAAMLTAVSRLAQQRPAGMPTIVMACTVNEEHGYSGANQLAELWQGNDPFLPRRPDAAVVAEPTNLNVVVAHKGAVRWRCHTRGRAAHSSQPHLGDNALYKMARVLLALEAYQREVAPTLGKHPLCGHATLSVGMIRGGLSVNTVPDTCTIEIDRRVIPGENPDEAFRGVVDFVAGHEAVAFPVEHEEPWMKGASLGDEHNGPLAQRLSAVARRLAHRGNCIGVPFGTDAAKIAAAGVSSVVFGPGSIDQAHTADEWLSLDELQSAVEILYQFCAGGLD